MNLPPLTDSEYDRILLRHLRPESWRTPVPPGRYHLVVVGGGTGGLVTAAIAAALGARVALIERGLMGGDCLNVGCVPSKALIAAARSWREARSSQRRFGGPSASGAGDFPAAMERMRRLRAELSAHDSPERFRGLGVDVWLGDATFTSSDRIAIGPSELRFRRAVVATGSRPRIPTIAGLTEAGFLTNETVFSRTALPRRLAVIGGGPIGCELSQALARFGSAVTLLELTDRILPGEDPDAAALVNTSLQSDGVDVHCGVRVDTVCGVEGGRTIRSVRDGETAERVVDEVLIAAGRAPNVDGLGLERAGVSIERGGEITVDDRLRTTNPRIYAIGDVAGPMQFTHLADAHARLVVRNALFFGRGRRSALVVPWCTFTSPEVAHVGPPYPDLSARQGELDSITVPLADVDRARLDGETDGFFRVHIERGSDRIIAATFVGPHAGDIISQVTQAMRTGLGLGAFSQTIYPYPTYAEALRKAGDAWNRQRLTPAAKKGFRLFFRALR